MSLHKILKLKLSKPQSQKLAQLNQTLSEQIGTLHPEMLADLTAEMKHLLETQTDFSTIATDARNKQIFYQHDTPLLLTCRYSVAEYPNIPTFDLNQVSRNDFIKNALQLSLTELPKKYNDRVWHTYSKEEYRRY